MKKPRALLADDHSLMLAGLRRLLEDDCEVVGTVEDGRALVEAAARLQPDLVLLDISMPLLNGMEAARQIRKVAPGSKLLFLTMHASPTYATEAFQVGASGYILKRAAASELTQAIRAVMKGQYYLSPLITKDVLQAAFASPREPARAPSTLTSRQREVLQLLAEGHGTKEIATILNVSVRTVEFHKWRIMEQLDLHSTAELTKYAVTHGLTTL